MKQIKVNQKQFEIVQSVRTGKYVKYPDVTSTVLTLSPGQVRDLQTKLQEYLDKIDLDLTMEKAELRRTERGIQFDNIRILRKQQAEVERLIEIVKEKQDENN